MNIVRLFCAATWLFSASLLAGEKINEVLDISASGQVSIESMRGVVEIVGWDKQQMSVVGELDDKATGYVFESENGFTEFKVKMPKRFRSSKSHKRHGSNLKIHLPFDVDLVVESVNGDLSVKAISGGVNAHTVNGNIRATELSRRIRLETVNGNINASQLKGKIKLTTVNGEVVDKKSSGKVQYETVNGVIDADTEAERVFVENVNGEIGLQLKAVEELEISTINGDVNVSLSVSEDANVNVTTISGSARLRFADPVGGKFRLSAHAGGRIKNRLTSDKVIKQKYGSSSKLKFSKDGGNANVEMTTVSGSLIIEAQ